MKHFVRGKRRQLPSLGALGLRAGLLTLARTGQPAAFHGTAPPGPVTAGYWDGPQLPRF
jgi:hypothetical protein